VIPPFNFGGEYPLWFGGQRGSLGELSYIADRRLVPARDQVSGQAPQLFALLIGCKWRKFYAF
jgi:hypothetical protein